MRRAFTYAPIALLTAGCASRPWTPSVSVAYWSQEVPAGRATTLPTYQESAAQWQLPAENPWAPYQKMTLLSALDTQHWTVNLPEVRELEVVGKATEAAMRLAESGLPPDTMWMVDLRGAASVAFGATLSRYAKEPVAPVLTFNNWPAEYELIPAEETLSSLVSMQPRLPQSTDQATRPVFLLDAWRLAYRNDNTDDDVTDNRYMIQPSDLPDPATLRAQGISRVLYLVESLDDTGTEEDDLHEVMASYQAAGIALFMVDLAWTSEPLPALVRYHERLAMCSYQVVPRVTLVTDARFYARSRGGFGGVYGAPLGAHNGGYFGGGHGGFFGGGHGGFGGHGGG